MSVECTTDKTQRPFLEPLITLLITVVLAYFCVARFGEGLDHVMQSSDTAWLIKTGQYMLARHHLPATDIFSWTCPDRGWVTYQWLFELLVGSLYQAGGLWLVGLGCAMLSATAYFWLLPRQMLGQNVRIPFIFGLLCLTSSPVWFWARPQLVSFILIPVFVNLLEGLRTGGYSRKLWLLPILMVFWCNAHSFWFIGLLLVTVYIIARLTVMTSQAGDRSRLLWLLLACFVAVTINPFGWSIVPYNLSFVSQTDFSNTWELQPRLWLEPLANREPILYLTIAWVSLIAGRKHVPVYCLLLALTGTVAALLCFRFLPVAVLLTWPYLAVVLGKSALTGSEIAAKEMPVKETAAKNVPSPALVRALPVAAVILGLVSFAREFPQHAQIWFTYDGSNQAAIGFLKQHPKIARHMFCDAAVGCSQILEGLTPVFIDTRFDLYGKTFCQQWHACLAATGNWRGYLSTWNISSICINSKYKLYRELKSCPDWLLVFDDGTTGVWLHNEAGSVSKQRNIAGRADALLAQ